MNNLNKSNQLLIAKVNVFFFVKENQEEDPDTVQIFFPHRSKKVVLPRVNFTEVYSKLLLEAEFKIVNLALVQPFNSRLVTFYLHAAINL